MTNWTQEERDRLKTLQTNDQDARSLHNGRANDGDPVPERVCRKWREQVREHDALPERMDGQGWAEATIRKHVTGDCSHSGTGGAVEYNGEEWVPAERGDG